MRDGATTSRVSLPTGKNLRPVVVRKRAAKNRSQHEDSGAANGGPHTVPRVIEFPNPPAADDVISERIMFEVGDDRFAIKGTAEIERLPPARPVVEQPHLRTYRGGATWRARLATVAFWAAFGGGPAAVAGAGPVSSVLEVMVSPGGEVYRGPDRDPSPASEKQVRSAPRRKTF